MPNMLSDTNEDTLFEQSGDSLAEPAQHVGRSSAADAAERAAFAAEAAAQAAQRAAGLVERVSSWIGWSANRAAPQEPMMPSQTAAPMTGRFGFSRGRSGMNAPMAEISTSEAGGITSKFRQRPVSMAERPSPEAGSMADKLKQRAITVGERLSDWSEGRYGLKPQQPEKPAGRAAKLQSKQRGRGAAKAAKKSDKQSTVSWLPWTIGMSLGLVVGLVGVVYWQRQRLQRLWGETSQRVQQTTDTMRRRIETSRSPGQQAFPRDVPTTPTTFTSLGSGPTVRDRDLDRPINGRQEFTNH